MQLWELRDTMLGSELRQLTRELNRLLITQVESLYRPKHKSEPELAVSNRNRKPNETIGWGAIGWSDVGRSSVLHSQDVCLQSDGGVSAAQMNRWVVSWKKMELQADWN